MELNTSSSQEWKDQDVFSEEKIKPKLRISCYDRGNIASSSTKFLDEIPGMSVKCELAVH